MNSRLSMMLDRYAPPIFGGIIILLVWEYVPAFFRVSKLLLPSPSSVVGSLWLIYDRGLLVENFLILGVTKTVRAIRSERMRFVYQQVSAVLTTHPTSLQAR